MNEETNVEIKKENKIKDFLEKKLNDKIKILIFLSIFVVFNGLFGLMTAKGVGLNIIFIAIAFAIIYGIEGVFKYYDKN